MTSMRIDPGMTAKVWAKRLAAFIESAENDGAVIFISSETFRASVLKDGKAYTSEGEDVSGEF